MAHSLNILTLQIMTNIERVMDEEEKKMVEIASYFVSICYAPWFLKSYLSQANDLEAIKTSFTISESY